MAYYSKILLKYPEFENLITAYLNLEEFHSKATDTMRCKRITITAFLNYLGDTGVQRIQNCKQKMVYDFVQSLHHLSHSTVSGKLFILRHFFDYLYNCGLLAYSGRELFPVILTNKRERILSFYSMQEVKQLVAVVDNTTIRGKRDLVIVLLAAELGMRSSDICGLKLSDIHWERSTIEFVQFKTKVANQLPLLENIKYAILDYLKNARPVCCSELLIVGVKNNYQRVSSSEIHSIVSGYFLKANIDVSCRKHGPHALRHSLASNMLSQNAPMHVIKDVLGHTNLNTTKIYLNIDINTLKKFALEVPYETI